MTDRYVRGKNDWVNRAKMTGLGVMAGAALIACGGDTKEVKPTVLPPFHPTASAAGPAPTPERVIQTGSPLPESILSVFPDLRQNGLAVKDIISVNGLKIPTKIYNTTDSPLNESLISSLYQSFDQVAGNNSLDGAPVKIAGNNRYLVAKPRPVKIRNMAVIPADTQRPHLSSSSGINTPAGTIFNDEAVQTYVELRGVPEFNDTKEGTTNLMATEICQQTIFVSTYDENGVFTNRDEALSMQEVVCNSLGLLYAMKMLNKPFSEYKDRSSKLVTSGVRNGTHDPNFKISLITFSEKTYNNIKLSGTVVK